ncbi:Hypothetical_protein [Hexamita inflata]|uniref:Hypothetical_protein n=1 Tax=Hexamita inflata TaxID=28002 RepID=A0AA86P1B4_9EUKA|nr:Hypothetical protein HINF_LOCUS18402 [Hexamita inflata]
MMKETPRSGKRRVLKTWLLFLFIPRNIIQYYYDRKIKCQNTCQLNTCSKRETFFIFQNSKPAGGTAELSDGKSYYVGIYLYDNFDPDLRRECVSETMLFCLKGQGKE